MSAPTLSPEAVDGCLDEQPPPAAPGPGPVPVSAELLGPVFDDLLVRIGYDDGTSVRVRRRPRAVWLCTAHGRRAECAHVAAAHLIWSAHQALTAATPTPTDEGNPS